MSLAKIALSEYQKRLTPIVAPPLQLLVDEAIEKLLKYGQSSIEKNNKQVFEVSIDQTPISGQLSPLNANTLAVFALNWELKPLVRSFARNISEAHHALTQHMNLEISTHGHLLRYINNLAQVRLRQSDQWVDSGARSHKGENFLTFEKDADNQTASLNQLNQASAEPFIESLEQLLQQFENYLPLPAGIGSGDGARFNQQVEIYRKKIELSMSAFEKRVDGLDFQGFYDPPEIGLGADSATADGLLKQAQAQQILSQNQTDEKG